MPTDELTRAERQKMMRDSLECCADEFFLEARSEGLFAHGPDIDKAAQVLKEGVYKGRLGNVPAEIEEPDEFLEWDARMWVREILQAAFDQP